MSDERQSNGGRNGPVLRWHRMLGAAAALFVVFLSVTGVLLNHGPALDLDRRTLNNPVLLEWYGLNLKGDLVSYQAGAQWVTGADQHLFLNGRAVAEHVPALRGAAASNGLIAAATATEVFLLTAEGDLVERLNDVPAQISRLGVNTGGHVVLETEAGNFAAKPDFMGWTQTNETVVWGLPVETPDPIRQKVLVDYRGTGLPWSRVLLDLHSGRLLGAWGPYLMDAVALALIILAITGLINWKRRR
jgi:hypothetical protein